MIHPTSTYININGVLPTVKTFCHLIHPTSTCNSLLPTAVRPSATCFTLYQPATAAWFLADEVFCNLIHPTSTCNGVLPTVKAFCHLFHPTSSCNGLLPTALWPSATCFTLHQPVTAAWFLAAEAFCKLIDPTSTCNGRLPTAVAFCNLIYPA